MRAVRRQGHSGQPWRLVQGPAGAVVATLRRLGWEAISPCLWADDRGVPVDLEKWSPAYDARRGPIVAWASAWFETAQKRPGCVPACVLRGCFMRALRRLGGAARPWRLVQGPAGAVVATLRRLGWEVLSPSLWLDDRGVSVDLQRWGPVYVGKLITFPSIVGLASGWRRS